MVGVVFVVVDFCGWRTLAFDAESADRVACEDGVTAGVPVGGEG